MAAVFPVRSALKKSRFSLLRPMRYILGRESVGGESRRLPGAILGQGMETVGWIFLGRVSSEERMIMRYAKVQE
jgi:hypothetical protein